MSPGTRICCEPQLGKLLAAYELGLLDPGERGRLEVHLRHCEFCQDELFALAPYVETMRRSPGALADRIAARLDAGAVERRPRLTGPHPHHAPGWAEQLRRLFAAPGRPLRLAPSLIALGTAAALLLLVFLPGGEPPLGRLAEVEPLPYTRIATRAGGAAESARLFATGMALYGEGRYADCIAPLERAARATPPLPGPQRDQADLYRGVAQILLGDPAAAEAALARARSSALPVIADRATWYLAQAALRQGEAGSARRYLESLAGVSPAYGERAARQLEHLEQLAR